MELSRGEMLGSYNHERTDKRTGSQLSLRETGAVITIIIIIILVLGTLNFFSKIKTKSIERQQPREGLDRGHQGLGLQRNPRASL